MTPDEAFMRPLPMIQNDFAVACARRILAVRNRDKALIAAAEADEQVLAHERIIGLLDRQIANYLDEAVNHRRRAKVDA